MSTTAAGRTTPIFVERRFPLDLSQSIGSIRELYDAAKAGRWDPHADIPWHRLRAEDYADDVRRAAGLSWSRRVWTEYTALPETPSLLIRFCIEQDREADPKFYLTVRNTEEAWHVEACHRFCRGPGALQE